MRGLSRGLTTVLMLLTSACARTPPPTAQGNTGKASSTIHIDASRTDAALLEHLVTLPAPRDIASVVSEGVRGDLEGALSALSKDERGALLRGEKPAIERHPVLALMVGTSSTSAMRAACCQGSSSRELMRLREDRAPIDDLPASIRSVAKEAALTLAKEQLRAAAHGPPLSVSEAESLDQIARTLADARLSHLARAYLATQDASASRLALAASAAARDLDVQAARALLAQAGRAKGEASVLLHDAERDLRLAEAFAQAQGEDAHGEQALTVIEAAVRLGRADLVPTLIARSSAGEGDLRIAVASVIVELGGEPCGGLERSNEPAQLCAIAWRASPTASSMQARLERAFALGKGHTPWAIETYLGLHDVLPMSLSVMGSQGSADPLVKARLSSLQTTLAELPSPRGESLSLFINALSLSVAPQQGLMDDHVELLRRATSLLERAPRDPLAQRAALAVAAVLAPEHDATPLLEKLPEQDNDLANARDALLALLADRFERGEAAQAARARLMQAGGSARLLAAELGALTGASPTALAELERLARLTEAGDDDVTQLQKTCDLLGALLRGGRRAEAEEVFVAMASRLGAAPQDALSRELLALFETEGYALLATSPHEPERRAAQRKLADKIERSGSSASPELKLYRALWLGQLAAEQASRCAPQATACQLDAEDDARLARRAEGESVRQLHPHAASLVRRGHLALGGSAQLSLSFSLEGGIEVQLGMRPRVLVAPLPGGSR